MNSRVNFIFRALLLCSVVYVSTAVAFAQSVKHKCEVYIFDLSVSTSQIKTLGDFNIAVKMVVPQQNFTSYQILN